jgi:hypothetical protein
VKRRGFARKLVELLDIEVANHPLMESLPFWFARGVTKFVDPPRDYLAEMKRRAAEEEST